MSDLTLEIVEGPDAGKQIRLDGPIDIGRGDGVGLRLNDDQVSRAHARITPDPSGAVVEDLGSANGTFINQNELMGRAQASAGDEIQVGVTVMQMRSAQQVAAQPSAVRNVPPALAMAPRRPAYVDPTSPAAPSGGPLVPELERLVDSKVKSQARTAPIAVFALVILVVIVYLGTQ